ncbi:MAG: hypothetical protein K2N36_07310 [Ruminiclostridium sp.]|nr:hypothetical protein [Ruminiclostridium sp.]
MEILIKETPKEIADLALELQGRQKENAYVSLIQRQEEFDFSAAFKAVNAAAKKIHEEKPTPKYETREFHIFCGNASDSSSQNQQVKERTFGDVKKRFEKTLRDLDLSKN